MGFKRPEEMEDHSILSLRNKIYIGDGDDPQMLLRIRSQANFIETVPIALILFFAMESMGVQPGATLLRDDSRVRICGQGVM